MNRFINPYFNGNLSAIMAVCKQVPKLSLVATLILMEIFVQ